MFETLYKKIIENRNIALWNYAISKVTLINAKLLLDVEYVPTILLVESTIMLTIWSIYCNAYDNQPLLLCCWWSVINIMSPHKTGIYLSWPDIYCTYILIYIFMSNPERLIWMVLFNWLRMFCLIWYKIQNDIQILLVYKYRHITKRKDGRRLETNLGFLMTDKYLQRILSI